MKKIKDMQGTPLSPDYGDEFGQLQSTPEKRGHILRNILITLGVIIVLLAVALITAINLALQTGNLQKFSAQPDDGLIFTLAQSVVFGEEKDITDDALNAFFAFAFKARDEYLTEQGTPPPQVDMDALAVYFHQDRPSELYAKLLYKEQVVVLSGLVDIHLDADKKQFTMDIKEAKIGSLPVPADWIVAFLFQNKAPHQLSDQLSHSGSTVYVPSRWTTELMSAEVSFEIKEFKVKEKSAAVLTTSAMEALEEFFGGIFG